MGVIRWGVIRWGVIRWGVIQWDVIQWDVIPWVAKQWDLCNECYTMAGLQPLLHNECHLAGVIQLVL